MNRGKIDAHLKIVFLRFEELRPCVQAGGDRNETIIKAPTFPLYMVAAIGRGGRGDRRQFSIADARSG
ncbi:hypothetical protein [Bradyrhizobium yuanmingense]|uniref:hypothetical protein n=1 Tax=Bradyrhizobium yuanmingense TaxID=108015 RepID=UPI0023B9465C|nr:hypothetical protein [Bradyrhizobium yuanmingense]MDF0579286.1 hypothetical protein [Bradyrhizobium yuanmingense]